MVVEEGTDLDQLPKESVFATATIASHITTTSLAPAVSSPEERLTISKFLDEVSIGSRNGHKPNALVATPVAAFGAQ
jgi:hypothetical protein